MFPTLRQTQPTTEFLFLEFAGDAWDVGRLHGVRMREAIREQLDQTMRQASLCGLSRQDACAWAEEQLARIEALAPHWIDELRGLAHGASISLTEAAALQVRPGSGEPGAGCTSFAVQAAATADGCMRVGQNRDLAPAYLRRMFVGLFRPEGRPAMLMHCVAGELAGVGINELGVCVFANSLWSRSGRTWMAPPLVRRAILECASAEEAAERIAAMPGPAPGNYLVADAAGCVRNLEVLPEGTRVLGCHQGLLAHANNCLSPELAAHEPAALPMPGSAQRQAWLADALAAHRGTIDLALLKTLLADHALQPEALCRHAAHAADWETVSALIAEPATRTLHLSYGPPCKGRWFTYRCTSA
jgi:isopenicillin-N N-acyltransferase-like protein